MPTVVPVQGDRLPANRRVVVITGASSGIGRATARAFARRGDHVVLAARRGDELERTLELCGGAAAGRIFTCDIGDPEQAAALAASVLETEGACNVLVNNAGIGARMPFDGAEALDAFERVLAVNLRGAVHLTAHLLPLLRAAAPDAAVVNISSVAGLFGLPGAPIYCTSKFGLTGFTESLHFALHPEGIHVANIQPGPLETEGFPHARLRGRRRARLLMTDVDRVANAIVRASEGKGSPFVVLPRIYRTGVLIRTLTPPLHRALLRRAARRLAAAQARRRQAAGIGSPGGQ